MAFTPQGNPYTQAATGGMLWDRMEKRWDTEAELSKISAAKDVATAKAAADKQKDGLGTVKEVSESIGDRLAAMADKKRHQQLAEKVSQRTDGILQKDNFWPFNGSTDLDDKIIKEVEATLGLGKDDNLQEALTSREAIDELVSVLRSGEMPNIANWMDTNLKTRDVKKKNTKSLTSTYKLAIKNYKEFYKNDIKDEVALTAGIVALDRTKASPKPDLYWIRDFTDSVTDLQKKNPKDKDGKSLSLSHYLTAASKLAERPSLSTAASKLPARPSLLTSP
jgi:hypothetical protein